MRLVALVICLSLLYSSSLPALAQMRPGSNAPAPRGGEFDRRSPAVGEPLPDITIYDAEGRPFSLSRLRGHYTVLVFGCLT
ncbi:MAG: hypothetical protein KatS3mg110_0299 [Pirellulaceae bacterium]|nr:MAG: hypothetical protein KatS3mg110_0299 [Pirellulaceae bacterium]